MGWLSQDELGTFRKVGKEVKISRHCIIYGHKNILLGDNVRIDAGTIILAMGGDLIIGSHTHIASQCVLSANGGIEMKGFNAVSFGTKLISGSDDFGGEYLVGPMFADGYTKVTLEPIVMERNTAIGSASLVLPGVRMAEGSVLGANSVLNKSTQPWKIYHGTMAVAVRDRDMKAKELSERWLNEWKSKHYA